MLYTSLDPVTVRAPVSSKPEYDSGTSQADILTKSALSFVVLLHNAFNKTRLELLENRQRVQAQLDAGQPLDFSTDPELQKIRQDPTWKGAIPGLGLADRRTEITGPPERKMVVNALNSPVKTYMSDFEDSSAPTWLNVINGQVNLYDAVRQKVDFVHRDTGKAYRVDRTPGRHIPVLLVRPRGWHMVDKHIWVDGEPISASILDFGLYFFHNARQLLANGHGPYFYLPKMELHLEAKLWNNIFNVAQDTLGLPRGTIRATVLIETLPAAYQMEEIIYQLRDHSAGLNCGRWDYIFSTIKRLRNDPTKVLPDRGLVTMRVPFMQAYCERLVHICHKRQVHAMGGMAAQIPNKANPAATKAAIEKVENDKLREALMHFDGTWVAHPALAPYATSIFDTHMPTPNHIHVETTDRTSAADLSNTAIDGFQITSAGIRENLYIALRYMESWIRGTGCVPINDLMEDAATAEVSRLQLYLWVKHRVTLADTKEVVTPELALRLLDEETAQLKETYAAHPHKFDVAAKYLRPEIRGDSLAEFLTTLVYDEIVTAGDPIDLAVLKD